LLLQGGTWRPPRRPLYLLSRSNPGTGDLAENEKMAYADLELLARWTEERYSVVLRYVDSKTDSDERLEQESAMSSSIT